MKLLKKLLPIATVASVAAVVTPLTVSCARGISNNFDYCPTIAPHKQETFDTMREATAAYFTDVEENKDIFVQDIYAAFAAAQKESKLEAEGSNVIDKWNFSIKVDNVKINEVTRFDESAYTIYLVSFDLTASGSFAYHRFKFSDGVKTKISHKLDSSVTFNLKYIPFELFWDSDDDRYYVAPNFDTDYIDIYPNDISLSAKGKVRGCDVTENKFGTEEKKSNDDIDFVVNKKHIPEWYESHVLAGYLEFYSFHFRDCEID